MAFSFGVTPNFVTSAVALSITEWWSVIMVCANCKTSLVLAFDLAILAASISILLAATAMAAISGSVSFCCFCAREVEKATKRQKAVPAAKTVIIFFFIFMIWSVYISTEQVNCKKVTE